MTSPQQADQRADRDAPEGGVYEYVVMRDRDDQDPHRRPFRDDEDDRFGGTPMTPAEQYAWCRQWVDEVEADGARKGAFYIARRTVTPYERISGEDSPLLALPVATTYRDLCDCTSTVHYEGENGCLAD